MGAWNYGVFDDDTAYDALTDLKNSLDIIADMERYFDEVIQAEYIGYDEAHYALVSAAVIDSVINSFVYRCDEEDYFEWTSSQKCFDFSPLKQKAVTAIGAILSDNMKKVAEVFKEKTGKDYQTAVVWKMTTKKKLTKTVHTYYNWLMGYGIDDNNIPEIVLIPVDPKWDWIDEPIYCKKTNSEMTQDKKTSLFILKNDQLEDGKIDLQLISSVAMMENYLMDVNYMFDYEKLSEYCMKYWMGK